MCGIAGYFSTDDTPVPLDPIEGMLASLRHRGPDGYGVFQDRACVLGHARLSIIDLAGGWQPIQNEDRMLTVTFNGEIYNYLELRKDLESRGHRFRTRSDTEVIVHAYEEWGEPCVKRFNGQFAFAVFDAAKRSLFLCRDRFGVRPLFYAWRGAEIVFASEVKALLASGRVATSMSRDGLHQIFSLWVNVPPRTPFEGIHELPPAHTMLVHGPNVRTDRYWTFPVEKNEEISPQECFEGVLSLLDRSVALRLRADVPVGAYLSGGLDSGLTTTLITRWTDVKLKTFSLRFEDPRFDESEYQAELVRHLGTDHADLVCRPSDISANFEDVIWATEKPILRSAPVPMYLLSKLVRSEGYKVVITGEGADEFFLGYDIFKEAKVREFCSRVPASRIRPLLLRRLYPYLFGDPRTARFQEAFFLQGFRDTADPFYSHRIRWSGCAKIAHFYAPDVKALLASAPEDELRNSMRPGYGDLPLLDRAQITEIDTLLSGYLLSSQGDRVCMGNSVEGRYVFLDHELVEFASRIPSRKKMPGLREKKILKDIGREILPRKILDRHKFPYRSPDIDSFLKTSSGRDILATELGERNLKESGIFDGRNVGKVLARVLKAGETVSTTDNLVLMAALSTQMFFRRFFRSATTGGASFVAGDRILCVKGERSRWSTPEQWRNSGSSSGIRS